MLNAILTADIFAVFLVFARVGAAFVQLPTIGEAFITARARLLLAILIALLIAPVIAPRLPEMPDKLGDMIFLLMVEILYGLFIGTVTKILFNALAISGTMISMYTGLASAMMFNPALGAQGSLYSVFLSLLGIVIFFATNMHHLLIQGVVESYVYFIPGAPPPAGDFAESVARVTSQTFMIAFHLSAPFVMVSLLLYMLLGIMARLMPQLQIFFVALPVQVLLGMFVFLITIGGLMLWFLDRYRDFIAEFLVSLG